MSGRGGAPYVHTERRSDQIGFEDLRALFRLEGELGELPRASEAQRRHALEGLVSLVGAQVGIWGNFSALAGERGFIHDAIHLGWSSDRERLLYVDYLRNGQHRMPDPCVPRVAQAVNAPVCTFLREQLITTAEWYREAHFHEYRRAAGIDAFLHSVRTRGDAGYVISIHRPAGARAFSERERRLVDLFHSESRALAPPPSVPITPPALRGAPRAALSPQLDRTLRALLRGLSEKQAAAELGLSPHTVHEYVRTLYRRFGVTTRAELFVELLGRSQSA